MTTPGCDHAIYEWPLTVQSIWLGVVQPGTGGTVQVVLNDVSCPVPLMIYFRKLRCFSLQIMEWCDKYRLDYYFYTGKLVLANQLSQVDISRLFLLSGHIRVNFLFRSVIAPSPLVEISLCLAARLWLAEPIPPSKLVFWIFLKCSSLVWTSPSGIIPRFLRKYIGLGFLLVLGSVFWTIS